MRGISCQDTTYSGTRSKPSPASAAPTRLCLRMLCGTICTTTTTLLFVQHNLSGGYKSALYIALVAEKSKLYICVHLTMTIRTHLAVLKCKRHSHDSHTAHTVTTKALEGCPLQTTALICWFTMDYSTREGITCRVCCEGLTHRT